MPRLLHTSDWHLGSALETTSRADDHARFLAWLETTLAERAVDVLIVAGDVFDHAQPSAEAQRLYYGLLHRIAGCGVRQVVVIGGNHDSAARLDAPAELLGAMQVHVVGGMGTAEDHAGRFLVPVRDDAGVVQCVVLAVPYVHEYKLGVRALLGDDVDLGKLLRDGFARLYQRLTDAAAERFPGVTLVATGHLACVGGNLSDAPAAIHLVGTVGGLDPAIFDPRLHYVALGHLHRCFQVGQSAAWYSGSPIALTFDEARSARHVLVIDTAPLGPPAVERVQVPEFRRLVTLRGSPDSVAAELSQLRWLETQLAPLVQALVEVAAWQPGLALRLAEAAPPGAVLVRVEQSVQAPADGPDAPDVQPPALGSLTPAQVFGLLCQAEKEPPDDELLRAFAQAEAAALAGREVAP